MQNSLQKAKFCCYVNLANHEGVDNFVDKVDNFFKYGLLQSKILSKTRGFLRMAVEILKVIKLFKQVIHK